MSRDSICDFVLSITTSNVVWWDKNVKSLFQEVIISFFFNKWEENLSFFPLQWSGSHLSLIWAQGRRAKGIVWFETHYLKSNREIISFSIQYLNSLTLPFVSVFKWIPCNSNHHVSSSFAESKGMENFFAQYNLLILLKNLDRPFLTFWNFFISLFYWHQPCSFLRCLWKF